MADELPEVRVAAYLAGDLDAVAAAAFEAHLLVCDLCWAAVRADRAGRAAVAQLRELAPAGLADRIGAAVELNDRGAGPGRRRRRRWGRRRARIGGAVAVGVAVLVAAAVVGGRLELGHRPGARDPQVVSELVRLAGEGGPVGPIVDRSADAGTVSMTRMAADGVTVMVARSSVGFAMPEGAVPMTSTEDPWMARRGAVTLVCFNAPHPVLVAATLPAEQLEILARQLEQAD